MVRLEDAGHYQCQDNSHQTMQFQIHLKVEDTVAAIQGNKRNLIYYFYLQNWGLFMFKCIVYKKQKTKNRNIGFVQDVYLYMNDL